MSAEHIDVQRFRFPTGRNGGEGRVVKVAAGISRQERISSPGGEDYAFTRTNWPVVVEVYVSPTGRSVQVYVNDKRVHP